jgi:ATP-dependent Clp protease ATP-binding subunit ClpC
VASLIAVHGLWESAGRERARDQVLLFNAATTLTVLVGIGSLYLILFALSLIGALLLLTKETLADALGASADFGDYLSLAWLVSSLGADRIQAHARRKESFEELRGDLMELLRHSFRAEFLNRIDEIIVFRALSREQLTQITTLLLDRVRRRLRAQGIEPEFTDGAVEHLAEEGFDPEFGARPLRRAIQRLVETRLSRMVLGGELEPGDRVTVDYRDGDLRFEVARAEGEASEGAEGAVAGTANR